MSAWDRLKSLRDATRGNRIAALFDEDDERAEKFSASVDDLYFDFSKTGMDEAVLDAFAGLYDETGVVAQRDDMFSGVAINTTEGRAVLHAGLRNLDGDGIVVDGRDVMPDVRAMLQRMEGFARSVRNSDITDVVNIGIGGSDLGPAMGVAALTPFHDGPRCHFVSNVDGAHLADTLMGLDPATSLVIVASKTFTTQETMMNAAVARDWMVEACGTAGLERFVAISTALEKAADFGIPPERVFGFADWVGGRYSMWGPIGLSVMLAIGPADFHAFLRGGQAMDRHFLHAPFRQNLPMLLAAVGLWHHQVCGYPTRAVIPYEQRLRLLPAYLQQLEMESNGKGVARDGSALEGPSGPVVWGEPGTNGQHAFFQLLHQGTQIVPCEFMVGTEGHEPELAHMHTALVANCLAQAEALLIGRDAGTVRAALAGDGLEGEDLEQLTRQRTFPGNRPSTLLVYPKLTPFVLGQIIALYEHRVFVEGAVLGINSFDQWGVELGKAMANTLLPALQSGALPEGITGSTARLLKRLRKPVD